MKNTTTYPTYPEYHLPKVIDLAPLEAACRGLLVLFHALLDQGHYHRIVGVSRRVHKAVKVWIAAAEANDRLELKLAMLANPSWRAKVLKDLGGMKALLRWERIMSRRKKIVEFGETPRPHPSQAQRLSRAANLKKARLALVQNARRFKRKYRSFETPHPNVLIDRVKVDQEGQFRLAALKRVPKLQRSKPEPRTQTKVKSIHKIYYSKINPIEVYPVEFRAAEKLEPEDISHLPSAAFIEPMREQASPKSLKGAPPTLNLPP